MNSEQEQLHFIGVGGVGMSGIARVAHDQGMAVSGSDLKESRYTKQLRDAGVTVFIGQDGANIPEGDPLVVVSTAILENNPELIEARRRGLEICHRAQMLAHLGRNLDTLAVAGTHGKTTTSSMLASTLDAMGCDPTFLIGGIVRAYGTNAHSGTGAYYVVEADESDKSFTYLSPAAAIVTNIEADHLDFFKDLDDVEHSFRAFADRVPESGVIVANADDANTMYTLEGEERPVLTFGLEHGDVRAANLAWNRGLPSFDVVYRGDVFTHVALRVPGEHNVKNALAAAAAAIALAVEPEAVSEGLAAFRGAGRRFEHKGTYHGAEVYDDYAHHPGELHALLSAARTLGYERVICAFQPHTYTRTHALFNDFVEALRASDITLLAEIYAAREVNDIGISSKDLAARIPGSEYYATLPEVTERLRALARPGDLILTVGAGDIFTVGEALLREG